MSNDLPGLHGVTAFLAVRPNRVWIACEPDDPGALLLRHAWASEAGGDPQSRGVIGGVDGVACDAIASFYRDGVEHAAPDYCDAARPDEPTYVRPGIAYRPHHNRRLYGRASQAEGAAGLIINLPSMRAGLETTPEPEQPRVLRVELELLEPEGLSPFDSFVFAERMMQLWGDRMAARRDRFENPPPAPKPKRTLSEAEKGRRREKELANAIARGYRVGCMRRGHRARRVCSGGCVNRDSRPDLNQSEVLYAVAEGIHELPAEEIRARRAQRTHTRSTPYRACTVCTARWGQGAMTCTYCGGAMGEVVPAVGNSVITVRGGTGSSFETWRCTQCEAGAEYRIPVGATAPNCAVHGIPLVQVGGGGGSGGIAILRQLVEAAPAPLREVMAAGLGAVVAHTLTRAIATDPAAVPDGYYPIDNGLPGDDE